MSDRIEDTEAGVREAWASGDFARAATVLLKGYRQEIMSFLRLRLRERTASEEAFSMFAESVWKGLPTFGWRCQARTWAYTLARNVATRYRASPHVRAERNLALDDDIAGAEPRPSTRQYLRTTTKQRIRALRERLPIEDQELLVLRVDRSLPWRDLALALNGDVALDEQAVEREAARLRKSFERIKQLLVQMAEEEGLLRTSDSR